MIAANNNIFCLVLLLNRDAIDVEIDNKKNLFDEHFFLNTKHNKST